MFRRVVLLSAGGVVIIASVLAFTKLGPWHPFDRKTVPTPVSGFYLDMGASASLGFQPTGIVGHNGHRTNDGYSNDLVTFEATKDVTLKLREIGCPGETVRSILGQFKDACYTLPNTQLSIAKAFLRVNEGRIGLVTIDLGFNDIRPCMLVKVFEPSCATSGVNLVHEYLPSILRQIKSAAGPKVHYVGLEYSDPFLGDYLNGAQGRLNASETLVAFNQLNAVLVNDYRAAGIPVADVAMTYKSAVTASSNLIAVGPVPTNVAEACSLTWECNKPPFGPDDHPNNAGYRSIASTIEAQLPRKW
ncbi:MAG: hypothetical protein ABR963_02935 [Acidimicrobiales bacterium]